MEVFGVPRVRETVTRFVSDGRYSDQRLRARRAPEWRPLVFGYFAYVVTFLVGYFADLPQLNTVGALGMLAVALPGLLHQITGLKNVGTVRWALVSVVAWTASLVLSADPSKAAVTVKYCLGFVIFVLVRSARLPPVNRSRWRWALLSVCMVLVLFSLVWGTYSSAPGEPRLAGIFPNPNNLALMALAPLFFINSDDSLLRHLLVHGSVLAVLAMTGTSGAILAYAVAVAFHFRKRMGRGGVRVIAVVGVLGLVAIAMDAGSIQERVVRQFQVVIDNLGTVTNPAAINYGDLEQQYGAGALSGIWRVAMWSTVIAEYAHGDALSWVFGRGAGGSLETFGILPHNDYLRVLLEAGALGLLAYVGFLRAAWKASAMEQKYLLLMFAVYSFTENNLDNFLFVVLLMFMLGSCAGPSRIIAPTGGSRATGRLLGARWSTAPGGSIAGAEGTAIAERR